ncbi:hypothetical protein V8J36_13395 [Frigidibacter sp. MR17.14]|uniref:hypothetical protein n=1 Tax=Frigidibacter sp. MR17.14 TaxID=3126509 RepID=UPI003013146F
MTQRAVTVPALILLALLPTAVLASPGCNSQAAMSCAQGTVWDEATKTCVATTS